MRTVQAGALAFRLPIEDEGSRSACRPHKDMLGMHPTEVGMAEREDWGWEGGE